MTESEKLLFRAIVALHEEIQILFLASLSEENNTREFMDEKMHKFYYDFVYDQGKYKNYIDKVMNATDLFLGVQENEKEKMVDAKKLKEKLFYSDDAVNMTGEYQGLWVRWRAIEKAINDLIIPDKPKEK
jgi:hypothetical protein